MTRLGIAHDDQWRKALRRANVAGVADRVKKRLRRLERRRAHRQLRRGDDQ